MAQDDVGHHPIARFEGDEDPEATVGLPVEVQVRGPSADHGRTAEEVDHVVDLGRRAGADEVTAQGNTLTVVVVRAQSHLDHGGWGANV